MSADEQDKKSVVAMRIRVAREEAGLSQGQAAKRLDLHRPTISEIEAGRRKVSSEELVRFADLYGVDTGWLAGADPEENQEAEMARYQVAARKLSKMKPEDFESLMKLLDSLQKRGGVEDV